MSDIERTLRQAGRRDHSAASERASRKLADVAADSGLLDVAYMRIETPFGPIDLAATRRGLVRISFERSGDSDSFVEQLAERISPRVVEAPSYFDAIRRELDDYFGGRRTRFDLPLDWSLTGGFARRVLEATARIPYGGVSTYRDVARKAGNELAVRAAGNALGANPIPIVVPCHRVIRSSGEIGNYGGGPEMKEGLLRLEGAIT